jgi:DNA-binding GntR family transcriptional regulator
VYETLRTAIVSVRLEPRLSVSEHELAQRLGVSRTPVREALIRLSEEGLVGIYPQTGTVISPISFPKVYQSLVIRSALECRSIRYAIRMITPEEIDHLAAIIADQKRHMKHRNVSGFLSADDEFHRTMVELSCNRELWKVIESTKAHHDRVRHLATHVQAHNERRIEEHEEILEAVDRGDASDAERLLEVHLSPDRLDELWERLSESHPAYLEPWEPDGRSWHTPTRRHAERSPA